MSTGTRADPVRARDLFERLMAAAGPSDERRGGAPDARTIADVFGALDEDLPALSAHFQRLYERLPGARSVEWLRDASQALLDRDLAASSPRQREAAALSFTPSVRTFVDACVRAGRCPACAARNKAGFARCIDCGYVPRGG